MKQLRYIGSNQPYGMIIEAPDEKVDTLVKSGDYEEVDKVKFISPRVEKVIKAGGTSYGKSSKSTK